MGRHFDRCLEMVKKSISQGAKIVHGSLDNWKRETLEAELILLTLDRDLMDSNVLLNEEIFGPATVITVMRDLDDAIEFIQEPVRDEPLALYVGTTDNSITDRLIRQVGCGSLTVNGLITQHNRVALHAGGL